MTVEPINDIPSPKRRTKPQREDYREIRESLMENENRVCIVAHGEMWETAHNMTVALRGTKPKGNFHASEKSFSDADARPEGLEPGTAVYAGYKLDDVNLEKLMGKAWMDKYKKHRN